MLSDVNFLIIELAKPLAGTSPQVINLDMKFRLAFNCYGLIMKCNLNENYSYSVIFSSPFDFHKVLMRNHVSLYNIYFHVPLIQPTRNMVSYTCRSNVAL